MLQQREYFQGNPVKLDVSRSKFPLNHKFTTTFEAGHLMPCLAYSDVLPGDTFKLDLSFVCRSTTPVAPIMDDAEIQIEFYFVPHKLVLSRSYMSPSINDKNHSFEAWIGAQDSLLNMPLPEEVLMPSLRVHGSSTVAQQVAGSLLCQMGYPALGGDNNTSGLNEFLSPLPLLAYYSVWNEFFRDSNLWSPVVFTINSDATSPTGAFVEFTGNGLAGIPSGQYGGLYADGFLPAAVARYHGYFGSCLPWPQRNSTAVTVPLGDTAPVYAGDQSNPDFAGKSAIKFGAISGVDYGDPNVLFTTLSTSGFLGRGFGPGSQDVPSYSTVDITPRNLYADLRNAVGPSVNALRIAIQTQRLYEQWARGGNRIQDMTAIFGVVPHDMGDDRPEFLGGKRIPLNVIQVNNTAGTTTSTSTQMSIGSTGAYSNTSDTSHYFTKSFDTWGTVIGVYCVRHKDTFPNMLPKMLSRKSRMDVYWPTFANLGEMPVLKKELEFNGTKATNQDVFGYQEAYAEYRYLPDRVAGSVSPLANAGYSYWTYACGQFTDTQRTLSGFLDARDQVGEFDQTLQVSSSTAGFQFLIQFYFDITAVRPMPLYSIPGLMDHH